MTILENCYKHIRLTGMTVTGIQQRHTRETGRGYKKNTADSCGVLLCFTVTAKGGSSTSSRDSVALRSQYRQSHVGHLLPVCTGLPA